MEEKTKDAVGAYRRIISKYRENQKNGAFLFMMMQHLRCLILETFSVGLSYDIKTKEI
jgi:hypothetical protein